MLERQTFLLLILLALLVALWALLRWRRRRERGKLVEVERRHDATLSRFHVDLDRFKFTRQGQVKVLLNHDHAIATKIEEHALEGAGERALLRLRVNRYVEEIVPFFKPLAYYRFGFGLAHLMLNGLYRVDFRPEDVERIKTYSQQRPRSVIYVMNHRSNVDYVLAAYVLAEKLALSFAVGEWARVWPLEYLFKAFGSYFLRRGFRDPLYHTVLRRYVQLVTKNGVTQALFPEGGLSRDGRLRPPKIGLLDYILCAKEDRSFARELVFVPMAINYDRVLEDRALVAEATPDRPKSSKLLMARHVLRILFGNASKFARRRIRKNGYAAVRIGEPVSFDAWASDLGTDIFTLDKEERRNHVVSFCNHLQNEIARLVPATPLCVVAKALLEQTPVAPADLTDAVAQQIEMLQRAGVDVVCAERGADWFVEGALLRFELRRLVQKNDGLIEVPEAQRPVLQYYANAIAHHLDGDVPQVAKL